MILRDVFMGIRRFEELQRHLGVARNILQTRLERLVEAGSCASADQERPLRHEYRLTEKGADLWPVLVSLLKWGDKYAIEGERPMILQHRDCGGELDDRRRCVVVRGRRRGERRHRHLEPGAAPAARGDRLRLLILGAGLPGAGPSRVATA